MTILLSGVLVLCAACLPALAAETSERPNVVVVMLDDFGYECVGANGGTSYQTPHFDALAASGARGVNCHVQPLCTPTRVQLMTGQYNVRNYIHFGELEPNQTTFAHLFKRAGYDTCIAGKWQLGRDMKLPAHFGFDQYCLWQLDRRPPRYANAGLEIDGEHVDLAGGKYGPDVVNEYAREFIAEHQDRPFFLYYPMILTHAPFQPTPDSEEWDPKQKGERGKGDPKLFADMVTYADKLIGQLVQALDDAGVRDNTLLIVVGDNGTPQGVVSRMGDRVVHGGKGKRDHTGTHVPLVVSWPGKVAPGTELDDLIDSTDFLPTICAAAEVPIPDDMTLDGRSFLPQLRGEAGNTRSWIYCWYARNGGRKADFEFARDKRFKLYRGGQLYDLANDLDEEHPLDTASLSAEAEEAKKQLAKALQQFDDARPAAIASQGQPLRKNGKKRAG